MKLKPEAYVAMAKWHQHRHHPSYALKTDQTRASIEGAPVDALYRRADGRWVCVSDLTPEHPFHRFCETEGSMYQQPATGTDSRQLKEEL
jgi:hypothetical protein